MQSSVPLRAVIESYLGGRMAAHLSWRDRSAPERVPAGIAELDALTGGLPRGSITEIHGPASSGRSSLIASILAAATARQEICAYVDSSDAFDPVSAETAGVDLARLLWIRCGGHPEHALKTADLLIQNGGFGLVVLDLGDISTHIARRIPLASWFRFSRTIENTPTVMVMLERSHTVKTCAALTIEMRRECVMWSGAPACSRLLRGARLNAVLPDARTSRKSVASERTAFDVSAVR